MSRVSGNVYSQAWDPASIPDGDMVSLPIVIPEAKLGDYIQAWLDVWPLNCQLTGAVNLDGVVRVTLSNSTGVAADVPAGNLYVKVIKKGTM